MPGRSAEGGLPLVIDTSAWARVGNPAVRGPGARFEGRLRLSPVARLEFLSGARDAEAFDALTEELSAICPGAAHPAVASAAEEATKPSVR